MTHLLLRIEPSHIRREPYIPTVSEFPILKAGEIGIKANPIAAVFIMPGPASYVGGDIVSGMIYSGLHREELRFAQIQALQLPCQLGVILQFSGFFKRAFFDQKTNARRRCGFCR